MSEKWQLPSEQEFGNVLRVKGNQHRIKMNTTRNVSTMIKIELTMGSWKAIFRKTVMR